MDFSYNNVNVQNIKDAFAHFSNIVVSDFDPFSDRRILEFLYGWLKKSDVYVQFFPAFMAVFSDERNGGKPAGYLDLENSLEKFINAHPNRSADTKVKVAQYFTILNRIEYVITLDKKYSERGFLLFFRKFNTIYNMLHRPDEVKDSIEVYFDNQIGIIEVETAETRAKKKRDTKIAEAQAAYHSGYQYAILDIIAARNEYEEHIGSLIQEFKLKIEAFFDYVKSTKEGQRLIVKIKSNVSEEEIYGEFERIYRRYKILFRKQVGEYFFQETGSMVDKLCADFEVNIRMAKADGKG